MKNLTDLIHDIRAKSAGMKKLEQDMPRIIGVESVKILRQNFLLQGYDSGSGVKAWKKRSPSTDIAYMYNRTAAYRTPKLHKISRYKNPYKGSVVNASRQILTQTGNLRDSLTYQVSGKRVTIGVYPRIVTIGGKSHDALAYAKILNEGGSGKWGKHSTKIPKRQFMPRPNDPPNQKIINVAKKKYYYELDKFMHDWKRG